MIGREREKKTGTWLVFNEGCVMGRPKPLIGQKQR